MSLVSPTKVPITLQSGHWPKVAVDEEVREEVRWMVEERDAVQAQGTPDQAQGPEAATQQETQATRPPVERRALIPRVVFGRP